MTPIDEQSNPVPERVREGLLLCQRAGTSDMTDPRMVLRWLRDNGQYVAADWVEQNTARYLEVAALPDFLADA